jgi:hypothetical protein
MDDEAIHDFQVQGRDQLDRELVALEADRARAMLESIEVRGSEGDRLVLILSAPRALTVNVDGIVVLAGDLRLPTPPSEAAQTLRAAQTLPMDRIGELVYQQAAAS